MENGLPDTVEEIEAEIAFYTYLKSTCEAIRKGEEIRQSGVAARESLRCDELLHKLNRKLARLKKG